jgi:hypothetical protein
MQVFVARNRTSTQRLFIDGVKKRRLSAGFDFCLNEITHGRKVSLLLKMTKSE